MRSSSLWPLVAHLVDVSAEDVILMTKGQEILKNEDNGYYPIKIRKIRRYDANNRFKALALNGLFRHVII